MRHSSPNQLFTSLIHREFLNGLNQEINQNNFHFRLTVAFSLIHKFANYALLTHTGEQHVVQK